jgi:hypothetical protein
LVKSKIKIIELKLIPEYQNVKVITSPKKERGSARTEKNDLFWVWKIVCLCNDSYAGAIKTYIIPVSLHFYTRSEYIYDQTQSWVNLSRTKY